MPILHFRTRAQEFFYVSQNLWCKNMAHNLFHPLTDVHSAPLLPQLCFQSLHCLCFLHHEIPAFVNWASKGEAFCLIALIMLLRHFANKNFFLQVSYQHTTQAWQGLQILQNHFWSCAGFVKPTEVAVHRRGLATNWLSDSRYGSISSILKRLSLLCNCILFIN